MDALRRYHTDPETRALVHWLLLVLDKHSVERVLEALVLAVARRERSELIGHERLESLKAIAAEASLEDAVAAMERDFSFVATQQAIDQLAGMGCFVAPQGTGSQGEA